MPACGDDSNLDRNLVISPAEATAKIGDTVEWINKDVFAHTATRGALKLTFVSETVAFFICDHWIT